MANYLHVMGAQVTIPERNKIKELAELVDGKFEVASMVNVGVMVGATMWCLRAGAPGAILYGVDIDYTSHEIEDKDNLRAIFITGDSTKVHAQFNKPIHLLLIDGDHHYETVKQDIAGWIPKVVKDGIIMFHDYAPTKLNLRQFPHLAGVKRAVDEWYGSHTDTWTIITRADSIIGFQRND